MKAWVIIKEECDYDSCNHEIEAVYMVPDDFDFNTAIIAFYDSLKPIYPKWFRKDGYLTQRYGHKAYPLWLAHVKATYQSIPFIQ